MQTMSTAMATLLKSKTMIGDNKPTAEVVIGEGAGSYDWVTATTTKYPTTEISLHGSFEKSSDGSILYVYTRGNIVYQSNIVDVETLLLQDDSITDETAIFTNLLYPRATLFKVDGILYLGLIFTSTVGEVPLTGVTGKEVIYKSVLGDGSDWSLYSTITSITAYNSYVNPSGRDNSFPKPYVIGERWILPITDLEVYGTSGMVGFSKIKVSIDNGITWVNKYIQGGSSPYQLEWGRNIVKWKDKIWVCGWNLAGLTGHVILYNTSDLGETWNIVEDIGAVAGPVSPLQTMNLLVDNQMLYWFINSDSPSYLYGTTVEPTSWSDFTEIKELPFANGEYPINIEIDGKLIISLMNIAGSEIYYTRILGVDFDELKFQPKSINISRNKGMAGSLTLEFDNKAGILAPDGTSNPKLLWPNKKVVVKQGYGAELLTTFTGLIDNVSMNRGSVASVTVSSRDNMKPLLDHYLRNAEFLYTLTYTNMAVETIWENLMILAGVDYDTIEETGLTITEKQFSWETYGDAISWLDEIAGFQTYCDEFGNMNFVRDGRPVDVTTAYSFVEGVDIISLGYDIYDKDLYYAVAVYGKAADDSVIYYAVQFPQAVYWNIPSGKVMRIDAPDADTQAKCEIIADKAIYLMQTRARQVQFESIGIPHLQIGDFIQVTESSTTISEIYRITDISTTQTSGEGAKYTMNLTCYYHAAPEV